MAFTAENVTDEGERAGLIRDEPYFFNHASLDLCAEVKLRQFESVMPVLTDQFQRDRHAFLNDDFARLELKRRSGNADDLLPIRVFFRRRHSRSFLHDKKSRHHYEQSADNEGSDSHCILPIGNSSIL